MKRRRKNAVDGSDDENNINIDVHSLCVPLLSPSSVKKIKTTESPSSS